MPESGTSERVLVLAPGGRDAFVAGRVLDEAGIATHSCRSLADCLAALGEGAGMVLVADEALQTADLRGIAAWVAAQPSWSDLPFVVLTRQGASAERDPAALRLTASLGNVAFVERPFHATTLSSVAASALRGRRRQYETRGHLLRMREAEERLRMAIEAGRLGTWEFDPQQHRLFASDDCRRHFGRAPHDRFDYDDLLAAVHEDDRERRQRTLARSIAEGLPYSVEYRVVWPDGSVHWINVKGHVRFDVPGTPGRMVGVTLDVTERRNAEEERERLLAALSAERAALEARVAERTRDLEAANARLLREIAERAQAEQQLRQAQKLEALGQLVGGVAHDFNNLLMAIVGNLEVVQRRVRHDAGLERMTSVAMSAAQRGAALTQRLLAFARRQDLQPRPTDVALLLHGVLPLVERSIGPMVRLRVDVPASLPAVRIDPNQLEMAVLNLALNARDAMPEGGPLDIALRTERLAAPGGDGLAAGDYVLLAVTDTGQGMSEDTLRRAVEPFFSTKGVGRGSGLGLSMVHGLATQSGGALRLTSRLGHGTTAALWLPVSSEPACVPAPAPAPEAPACRTGMILVVDDDDLVLASTAAVLDDLGYHVVEAASGAAALQALAGGLAPDLMVTDQAMPGMTGLELIAQVRRLYPGLPVLLATGYADLPRGAADAPPRLAKPYNRQQICAVVDRLLGPS